MYSVLKGFLVRDGYLIAGQQQYSGAKVAEAVIAALGVCGSKPSTLLTSRPSCSARPLCRSLLGLFTSGHRIVVRVSHSSAR